MGSGLLDLKPITVVERRENGRKLILPPNEVEENQVVPPERREKRRKLILPPDEVKENQVVPPTQVCSSLV
ncbi:hypothetical protein ACE6H2_026262 [Prunus campanulata]